MATPLSQLRGHVFTLREVCVASAAALREPIAAWGGGAWAI